MLHSFTLPLSDKRSTLMIRNKRRGVFRTVSNVDDEAFYEKNSIIDIWLGFKYASGYALETFSVLEKLLWRFKSICSFLNSKIKQTLHFFSFGFSQFTIAGFSQQEKNDFSKGLPSWFCL